MKRLSRNDIEAIATRVVNAYMKLPELQGQPICRIDPDVFAKSLLHLNIEYARLSRYGDVLGLTAFEPAPLGTLDGFFLADGNTLLIESNLNEEGSNIGRRNFTIMHEACHHVLKILFPEDFIRNPYDKRPVPIHYCRAEPRHHEKITDWKEWQTNTLTSAVFLPKQLVEQAMELVGLKGKIKRLNRLFYKQEFDQFTRMTEILGCSKIALSIRMKQLGLIGESYLDNPYRLLDVEVD